MTLPHYQIRLRNRRPSNEELLDDLRQVFRSCRRRPISGNIYASRGQFGVNTYVDHIVPWSKGGATTLANLQTLCSVGNIGKGNRLSPRRCRGPRKIPTDRR
jgi:5-methylcytosine-specific restriction endonuclease McrA